MRKRTILALGLGAVLALPRRTASRPRPGEPGGPPVPSPLTGPPSEASAPSRPGRVREALDVLVTSLRAALAGNVTDVAASLAFYGFLAIPAILLVAVGAFGVFAGPSTIQDLLDRLTGVVPDAALSLINDSLTRVTDSSGSGASLAIIGLLLAIWTASGAMSALMRGLNRVHEVEETRAFVRQRLTAIALLAWTLLAIVISFTLLVLGAPLSRALGDALDAQTLVGWLWWGAQWPILGAALLVAVMGILRLGPCEVRNSLRAELAGGAVAVVISVIASAGFGFYVSGFGNYGAAWGSLSAVIVMLTWLWLTSIAVLLGAHVQAETERRGH